MYEKFIDANIYKPIRSAPPVVEGGAHPKVTVLEVTSITLRPVGGDGTATKNTNLDLSFFSLNLTFNCSRFDIGYLKTKNHYKLGYLRFIYSHF